MAPKQWSARALVLIIYSKVSNTLMSRSQAVVLLLLSLSFIPAFSQRTANRRDAALVDRAKKAIISAFDPALPNITLESFLKYETEDPLIDWRVSHCSAALYRHSGKNGDDGTCVQTYSALGDNRVVVIVIRINRKTSAPPELLSVTILESGLERHLNLIELPAAIHGAKPKSRSPRDLLPLHRVA
jgi:hypothetical protein